MTIGIPVEPFISPAKGSREYNSIRKALDLKPTVVKVGVESQGEYFLVGGGRTKNLERDYFVRVCKDADGQFFVMCDCPCGKPPEPEKVLLIVGEELREEPDISTTYGPFPCYHAAAVILALSAEAKEYNKQKK